MRIFTAILSLLTTLIASIHLQAQDGSNIMYGKLNQLDSSFIGDYAHLDLYRRSFYGKDIDTVTIDVSGIPTRFFEYRKDNGFDNWFKDQYLESVHTHGGYTLRIAKSRLDSISTDSLYVTNYLEFYDANKLLIIEMSQQIKSVFLKEIIVEVLIDADFRNERRHTNLK